MAPKSRAPVPIHLPGTTLEGGGQLLRIALGLSSLTRKPINITDIRGKRSGGGGLKAQHLNCVQWLGKACDARLSGVGLKSKEITFTPKQSKDGTNFSLDEQGGEIRVTQSTPGSINLILQAILPYILFSGASSPVRVTITGGTNVSNSPSYDYVLEVLIPMLALIGIPVMAAKVTSRGWSQGSTRVGSATYTITPLSSSLPAFNLTSRGDIIHVKAIIIAPRDTEQHFRDELAFMFEKRESRFFSDPSSGRTEITFEPSHHEKRYYLLLIATSTIGIKLGRDWLYDIAIRPGKTERIVPTMVKRVSDDLLAEIGHGGCVDEFMRDQVVVYQGLARGRSEVDGGRRGEGEEGELGLVKPSLHARTGMWVCKEMLEVKFDEGGGCEGLGFRPGSWGEGMGDEEGKLVGGVERLELNG